MNNAYFEWLVDRLGIAGPQHSVLLSIAHDILFYEIVRNDINRVSDGLALRDEYVKSTGNTRPIIVSQKKSCTILEMLIALSGRLNDIDYDFNEPNRTAHWFWMLIDNLNLSGFSDGNMNRAIESEIIHTFTRVVERSYGPNGDGGLFPLLGPQEDQREIEIWYQMQAWSMLFV